VSRGRDRRRAPPAHCPAEARAGTPSDAAAAARHSPLSASSNSNLFPPHPPPLPPSPPPLRPTARRAALRVVAGNNATGGPFAPIVVVVRDVMGKKEFNLFRGKAISLHSQVIKEFCKSIGADSKQAQGLIRTAKKNGEKLGFLA
jgi:hypothetical protein